MRERLGFEEGENLGKLITGPRTYPASGKRRKLKREVERIVRARCWGPNFAELILHPQVKLRIERRNDWKKGGRRQIYLHSNIPKWKNDRAENVRREGESITCSRDGAQGAIDGRSL